MVSVIQDWISDFLSVIFSFKNKGCKMKRITDYLSEDLVAILNTNSRNRAISSLVELIQKSGKLKDIKVFHKAILERENKISTGIGMGIAIPHAKIPELNDFFIVVGIQKEKGVDWKSLDENPVRIVFMIGGPDNKQSEYLKILSMLTLAIKNEGVRRGLLKISNGKELISIFNNL
jgi:nitrogen PTS system EIIA component